jgi:hypothetical protein
MKYAIYEHPLTRKFALLRLPNGFADGDKIPILPTDRWFENREAAVAAVPELLNREEEETEIGVDQPAPIAERHGPR